MWGGGGGGREWWEWYDGGNREYDGGGEWGMVGMEWNGMEWELGIG